MSTTGDRLHELIKQWFLSDYKPGCGCRELVKSMNENEPQWSLLNLPSIVEKMRAEASVRHWSYRSIFRHLPGCNAPLRWVVREAVRLAEMDSQTALAKKPEE